MNRTLLSVGVCLCLSARVFGDDQIPNVRCEVDKSVEALTQPEKDALRRGDRSFSSLVAELIEKNGPPEKHPELPDTGNAKAIDWQQAKRMLWNGLITTVMQTHKRSVVLVTPSGRAYRTTEPTIDDVLRAAALVDPCHKYIRFITE
jgi:hypothetical protein